MLRLLPILVGLLLLCAGAFAQAPPMPGLDTIQLQYPNADINTILDLYERIAGDAAKKEGRPAPRLIRPNQVLVGQLYIVVNDPVPRDEALKIIEITLLMNGFSLIPSEDGKIIKVFGNGVNPRGPGVPIISDPALLPQREQIVTYLFKLKFADPTELQQTLTAFIGQSTAGYTSVTALPKAQALIVTESTPIIRGLIRVVSEIDTPPAEVVSEFITLERADAKDVLEKLEKIFEKTPSPTGAPGAPGTTGAARAARPATTPEGLPIPSGATAEATGPNTVEITGGTTLTEDSVIIGKIKLTADTRTNRIHVVTRPINMTFVRTLIKEFDSDVKFGEPTERALRFVTAADVLEPVIKAIQDPGAKDDAGATGGQQQGRPGQTTTGRTTGQNQFGGGGGFGGGFGGGGGSQGFSEELQTQEVDTVPRAVTVGNTRIIADTRANKIIVLGNREVKDKIFKLLDALDVRAPQVMLHTVIGQLDLSDNEQFGVDYIIRKGQATGFVPTTPTDPTDPTNPGTPTTNTNGRGLNNFVNLTSPGGVINVANLLSQRGITQLAVAGSTGLSGFFTAGNTLDVIVSALESSGRFKVTQRPHVFTSNNKKAIIASGQEIAVPTQTLTSLTNTNVATDNAAVSSSIQFKRVALQLEVVPLINSEREVTLDVLQKVDEIVPNAERTIGGNQIPTIATRYIKTTVSVPNEGTLVLGGLIRQADNKSYRGIPYLSRIPLLGALFRSTTKDKSRSELVILIRPVVTMNPDESIQTRERGQEFFRMEPDLESTIYPPGIRKKARPEPEPIFREGAPPPLRERAGAPKFRG